MADDPLPRLRRRFFGALVLLGLLFGSLLGNLFRPGPVELLRVEPVASGLQLWFSREPELYSENVDGAVGMLFQAKGQAAAGRLKINENDARWRVQGTERGLLLHVVATRPLQARWSGEKVDGEWRLQLQIMPR
ncbi:hypothetical protein [Stutzerimonas stutzeri]|uniref:hypothetical protein n=1 Tax=Stutzerimonas stutzeri TaxID=316 RepID=UPI003013D65D